MLTNSSSVALQPKMVAEIPSKAHRQTSTSGQGPKAIANKKIYKHSNCYNQFPALKHTSLFHSLGLLPRSNKSNGCVWCTCSSWRVGFSRRVVRWCETFGLQAGPCPRLPPFANFAARVLHVQTWSIPTATNPKQAKLLWHLLAGNWQSELQVARWEHIDSFRC